MEDIRIVACDVFKHVSNSNGNKISLITAVHKYLHECDLFDHFGNKDLYIEKEVRGYLVSNGYVEALNAYESEDTWDYRLKQKGIDVISNHAGDLIEYEEHQLSLEEQKYKDKKKENKRFWIPIIISIVATIISLVSVFKDSANDEIKKLNNENTVLKYEIKLLNHRLLQIEQKDIVQPNKKADL